MEDFDFGEVVNDFIDYKMQDRYTAIPAVILTVLGNGNQMTVNVQPLVSISNRDGTVTDQATVLNVPLQQPASSKGGMIFPVNVGDNVMLIYSMRGIDTWKYGQGAPAPASDYRMFSKMDCIAIPCIFPVAKSITPASKHTAGYELGDVAIYNAMGGSQVEVILKQNGNVIVNSPGKVTVNCVDSEVNASSSVKYNTQDFSVDCSSYTINSSSFVVSTGTYSVAATSTATTTGSFAMNGSYILNGIAMENHGHTGNGAGNRTSNPVS